MDLNMKNGFRLHIPDDVMAIMEERYILVSDVEKVIDYSKRNNDRLFNPYTLHYVARLKLGNVACWVRYEEKGKEIYVLSVTIIEWKLIYYTWRYNMPKRGYTND